jgi:hypothetical protein
MSGVTILRPLYVFVVWTGTNLFVRFKFLSCLTMKYLMLTWMIKFKVVKHMYLIYALLGDYFECSTVERRMLASLINSELGNLCNSYFPNYRPLKKKDLCLFETSGTDYLVTRFHIREYWVPHLRDSW